MGRRLLFRCAATTLAVVASLVFISSCGSSTVKSSTKLISSTLSGARNIKASRALVTSEATCGTGNPACITPDQVVGKAYYAGMIVGEVNGLSLGPMLGTVEDPSTATAFAESELNEFNFGEQLAVTGSPTIGGPIPYPSDAEAIVQNFHVYMGYIDTTFTLTNSEASGLGATHVIRQVMADITGTEMKKGDTMYRLESDTDFKWCVDGSGCAATTRPATPVQNSEIASFSQTNEGNKTIPSFFCKLAAGHADVVVTKTNLTNKANSNTFTVDITMTNGTKFTTLPSTWAGDASKMAAAFKLPADPGDEDAGFTATITYTP